MQSWLERGGGKGRVKGEGGGKEGGWEEGEIVLPKRGEGKSDGYEGLSIQSKRERDDQVFLRVVSPFKEEGRWRTREGWGEGYGVGYVCW